MRAEVEGRKVEIFGRVQASLHHLVAPKAGGQLLNTAIAEEFCDAMV